MRRILLIHILVSFFMVTAHAQSSKNFLKKSKAERYFEKGMYFEAMKIYDELLMTDSLNKELNYYDGVCKFNLKQFKRSSRMYFERSDASVSPEWNWYYACIQHLDEHFESAIEYFGKYRSITTPKEMTDIEITRAVESSLLAMRMKAFPNKQKIINLGPAVNTKYGDYSPLVTANGKTLYFTSRRPGEGTEFDKTGRYYEDIFEVSIDDKSALLSTKLPPPVNSKFHDACTGIGADGESMLLFRSDDQKMKDGQIFTTAFDGANWSIPVPIDKEVNRPGSYEVSACVSLSGNEIYFSSNMVGGFGGKDLYRTRKLPNGKWSKPFNLGPIVNTKGDEDAPFIHPDNKHLYYSSNGQPGMGGYDVFVAEIDSNSAPLNNENLGYPINTTDDDLYFTITGDKLTGYYSSVRKDGFGEMDIYKIMLEGEEPYREVYEGRVMAEDGRPLESKITLIDKTEERLAGTYRSNRLTGKFILLILPGHNYEVIIENKEYQIMTVYLDDITEPNFYLESK
jgi:hypothetical protein